MAIGKTILQAMSEITDPDAHQFVAGHILAVDDATIAGDPETARRHLRHIQAEAPEEWELIDRHVRRAREGR